VIDHLVYATMNLAESVDELNSRLGVSLTRGGQHIADLVDRRYLEIIGRTPSSHPPTGPDLGGLVPLLIHPPSSRTRHDRIRGGDRRVDRHHDGQQTQRHGNPGP
jgi:hypothetical protein